MTDTKTRRVSASEAQAVDGVWMNTTFQAMDSEEKLTWLYLLTGPHTEDGVPGLFRLTETQVFEGVDLVVRDGDLSAYELVGQYIQHFIELGWLKLDSTAGVMRLSAICSDIGDVEAIGALSNYPNCQLVQEYLLELLTNHMAEECFRPTEDDT